MTSNNPRFSGRSIPWLAALWDHIERYDYWRHNYDGFCHAACDLFDGWCTPHDLRDLVRRRFLIVVPVRKEDQTSISSVTWFISRRGEAILRAWKSRRPIVTDLDRYPLDCCPNCGGPLSMGAN